jgi:hypothetical protein
MKMNGCHNRPHLKHFALVQVGWIHTNHPISTRYAELKTIPNPMSKDCQYQKLRKDDPKCAGCKHLVEEVK